MIVVVAITCSVVIAALVTAVLRFRDENDQLRALTQAMVEERDSARLAEASAVAAAEAVGRQRDEALERVSRAKRDAAEVANRLKAETAERVETASELESVRSELEHARATGIGGLADVLWDLSVRQSETTWKRSIAVDPTAASPFDGDENGFRTAVEIEVEAAREESGAALDVEWEGDADTAPERAVVVLAAVRDVINQLGTVATQTTLTVAVQADGVELRIESFDADGNPIAVSLPSSVQSGPGCARIA